MLLRVLEPEVMDSSEEAADYDAMDHSEVNRSFAADFLGVWSGHNPVLDLGTGTAQIPIELCRQSAAISVVAVDLAEAMLTLARQNVTAAGLGHRIVVERGNARLLSQRDASFSDVISNSIIHHIPEPRAVLAEALRVLAPGGMLFIRDLARPANEDELASLVSRYAGNATARQRALFAASLHAALSLDEMRTLVAGLDMDPSRVRMTSDRHWTWVTEKP